MAIAPSMRPGHASALAQTEPGYVGPVRLGTSQFCGNRYFAQDVLPFLTSLTFHMALLIVGIATYGVVRHLSSPKVIERTQDYVPTSGYDFSQETRFPLGIGLQNLKAMQNTLPDVATDANGWSDHHPDLSRTLSAAGGNDAAEQSLIGIGNNTAVGRKNGGPGPSGSESNGPVAGWGPSRVLGGGIPPGIFNVPGAGSQGRQRIVFICDGTGSMMQQFDSLRVELRKAVEGLRPPQSFNVVFFQENAPPPLDHQLLFASPGNKRRMYDYIDGFAPRGKTDPLPAIKQAFAMKPDVIYFLCDPSDFPDPAGTIELFRKLNVDKSVHVNTIAFIGRDEEGDKMLRQIASEAGGALKFVSEQDMNP